ncbi:Glucosylceramidase [Daphnia magna]|uniref:Glucosylceramidase n=3 Tax=Daphnia magna TaxID=35525 RepID=A0A0P5W3J8_9CRUS|nr:hypothetical protein OUZ56_029097 [Daphnia magna]KZS08348.1 Glucosylceramidase [Daphnia magna]
MMKLFVDYSLIIIPAIFCSLTISDASADDCFRRYYGESSFVCVCNATYCDSAPSVDGPLPTGQAIVISSTQNDSRFQTHYLHFDIPSNESTVFQITVNASKTYQAIIGFGGAFTDAAGINIAKLSFPAQELLLSSYFGTLGIEYGIGRVPIAGSDFSTYPYSYDDFPGDTTLSNFSLTEEDLVFKIPFINWAKTISSKPIKLFSSPWSGPAWMKSNNDFSGFGHLLPENYQPWAEYFVKFFEEYRKHDINFWALTAQNEPNNGRVPGCSWNCMGWSPEDQALFVGQNLGPTLANKGFGDVNIMVVDDQRTFMPSWPETVLADPEANKYVSGFGVHWYANNLVPPSVLTSTHEAFPDRFILATEACNGPYEEPVIMGSWERLESYAHDIIEDLNHWVAGWVDWNLVLDEGGGPNWAENYVDAPIIVNNTVDEFYKQPMFYAMGHFSKYIPEDSIRIELEISDSTRSLFGTAFLRPDGKRSIVILNRSDEERMISLVDADRVDGTLTLICPARSIHTIVYV